MVLMHTVQQYRPLYRVWCVPDANANAFCINHIIAYTLINVNTHFV